MRRSRALSYGARHAPRRQERGASGRREKHHAHIVRRSVRRGGNPWLETDSHRLPLQGSAAAGRSGQAREAPAHRGRRLPLEGRRGRHGARHRSARRGDRSAEPGHRRPGQRRDPWGQHRLRRIRRSRRRRRQEERRRDLPDREPDGSGEQLRDGVRAPERARPCRGSTAGRRHRVHRTTPRA